MKVIKRIVDSATMFSGGATPVINHFYIGDLKDFEIRSVGIGQAASCGYSIKTSVVANNDYYMSCTQGTMLTAASSGARINARHTIFNNNSLYLQILASATQTVLGSAVHFIIQSNKKEYLI